MVLCEAAFLLYVLKSTTPLAFINTTINRIFLSFLSDLLPILTVGFVTETSTFFTTIDLLVFTIPQKNRYHYLTLTCVAQNNTLNDKVFQITT